MFQGTPPKDLLSTDKLAKQLKFDDDESAQAAKLELLKELSELEDLLAKRFEAMKISESDESPPHDGTNGLKHEGSKDSRVVLPRAVPKAPAVSHGLSICHAFKSDNMSLLHIHAGIHACMHAYFNLHSCISIHACIHHNA